MSLIMQSCMLPASEAEDKRGLANSACVKNVNASSNPTRALVETSVGVREAAKNISRVKVHWQGRPKTVLIVTKPDPGLVSLTRDVAVYLKDRNLTVYVERNILNHKNFGHDKSQEDEEKARLRTWDEAFCRNRADEIDIVITMGGDGTVLYASWLFQADVPPILPFHLGSLGFLGHFNFQQLRPTLDKLFTDGVHITLRMRLTCQIYKGNSFWDSKTHEKKCRILRPPPESTVMFGENGTFDGLAQGPQQEQQEQQEQQGQQQEHQEQQKPFQLHNIKRRAKTLSGSFQIAERIKPYERFEILNDVVVDRGPSPYMGQLEVFGNEKHLTTVQADGLTVATPTGSTAYSLSAGGNLVHPDVPAILLTPICAHTLSFRPMLLPDSLTLTIVVPKSSRSDAWASFDGRHRIELCQNDFLTVSASKHPVPTICLNDTTSDWFMSLSRCLRWNERRRQKSFGEASDEEEDEQDSNEDYDEEENLLRENSCEKKETNGT